MSLTPGFAPDAKSQWRELSAPLQELVVDELDELALHPPSVRDRVVYRDTVYESEGSRHYLFMRFMLDANNVWLIGIYYHVI